MGFDSLTGGKEKAMAKTVCKLLGIVFIIVGVAGFVAPTLLGAHLNPAHNAVHLVSGAIALYFGFCRIGGRRARFLHPLWFGVLAPGRMRLVPGLRSRAYVQSQHAINARNKRPHHSHPARSDIPGRRSVGRKRELTQVFSAHQIQKKRVCYAPTASASTTRTRSLVLISKSLSRALIEILCAPSACSASLR